MGLHPTTFGYLDPTKKQKDDMASCRFAARQYAEALEALLPEGPDKTYVLRKLREVAMWVNVTITRLPDGTPRGDRPSDIDPAVKEYPADHPAPGDLGGVPL